MSFIKFIVEVLKKDHKFEYGCAMLYFDFPEMKNLHKIIKEDELYDPKEGDYGLETEPHISLLFGLHADEVDTDEILDVCAKYNYKDVYLEKLSIFENPDFDVLKINASGDDLYKANKDLMKYPHTIEHDGGYKPHCTVAYLKKGKGKEVLERFEKDIQYKITPEKIVYSKPDKSKYTRDL